jgi:hypothetical protein
MTTRATASLKRQLLEVCGGSADELCQVFDDWKAGFPNSEFTHSLFGKDGAYIRPLVDGKPYVLRHVHLMPVQNKYAFERCMATHNRGVMKGHWGCMTSDRVLVYATRSPPGGEEKHLLLFILDEPEAHETANMKTSDAKTLIGQLASCAADFIDDGSITA